MGLIVTDASGLLISHHSFFTWSVTCLPGQAHIASFFLGMPILSHVSPVSLWSVRPTQPGSGTSCLYPVGQGCLAWLTCILPLSYFFKQCAAFTYCCLHVHGCGAIYGNMGCLLGTASLKKTDFPFPSIHQLPIAPQIEVGLTNTSPFMVGFSWLELCVGLVHQPPPL